MTLNPSNPNSPTPDPNPDRDVLISRVVEGRAAGNDWLALQRLAGQDASVWNDLAASQDQAVLLAQGLDQALSGVEHASLPHPGLRLVGHGPHEHAPASRGLRRFRTALPWALAAALALAFGSQFWSRPATIGGANTASLVPSAWQGPESPEEALQSYLNLGRDKGTVVGELPQRYVVESRPAADGEGYDVMYVRQILERARVKDLYRTGVDESGRTVLLPTTLPTPVDTPPL